MRKPVRPPGCTELGVAVPGYQPSKAPELAAVEAAAVGARRLSARAFRRGRSRDQPGGGAEKIRGLKSGRLTMLALLPVARMTNRPLRAACFVTESSASRYAMAP